MAKNEHFGQLSDRIFYPENINQLQPFIDRAENKGGGMVYAPVGVHLIDNTITVKPNVTLYLPAGCIIEPSGQFTMVRLDAEFDHASDKIGKIMGNGMLRTNTDKITKSSISNFDNSAHILVDGQDNIRPSKDDPRNPADRVIDGINILGSIATDGGYGIHFKATGDYDFIWLLEVNAYTFGCEQAIRMEATGTNNCTINGNSFYGRYIKPTRIISEEIQNSGKVIANEYFLYGQASTAMDDMYHFEGSENWKHGRDFDTDRPSNAYVNFTSSSEDNYFNPGTGFQLTPNDVIYNGIRNVVEPQAESSYDSFVKATLSSDFSVPTSGNYETIPFTVTDSGDSDHRGEWNANYNTYNPHTRGRTRVNFHAAVQNLDDGDTCWFRIDKNGSNTEWKNVLRGNSSYYTQTFSLNTVVKHVRGDNIRVKAYSSAGPTINSASNQTGAIFEKTH